MGANPFELKTEVFIVAQTGKIASNNAFLATTCIC